jgi:hypothetical protein
MPRECPLGFDLSGPGFLESLCCSSVGLYFWHNLLLLVKYDACWRKGDRETKTPRGSPAPVALVVNPTLPYIHSEVVIPAPYPVVGSNRPVRDKLQQEFR